MNAAKKPIVVVTDSTADLPADVAERAGVRVVPLTVSVGGESFPDGSLTQAEFFSRMAASEQPVTTSQPSVGAFEDVYERALEEADSVLSVHISEKLSGTLASARQAAERFGDRVRVFDSMNLSFGLGFQVLEAVRAAAEGLEPGAAVERLEAARSRVRMIVGLDSLDNLVKGGRVGRVSALVGSLLHLKVTLTVEDGELVPVRKSRGEKAALAHTLQWVHEQMAGATRASFAVGHAMSLERAKRLEEALRARYQVDDMFVYEAGSVISAHTGTGWSVAIGSSTG